MRFSATYVTLCNSGVTYSVRFHFHSARIETASSEMSESNFRRLNILISISIGNLTSECPLLLDKCDMISYCNAARKMKDF